MRCVVVVDRSTESADGIQELELDALCIERRSQRAMYKIIARSLDQKDAQHEPRVCRILVCLTSYGGQWRMHKHTEGLPLPLEPLQASMESTENPHEREPNISATRLRLSWPSRTTRSGTRVTTIYLLRHDGR